MRKVATGRNWICESSHTDCVFHTLREVGAERIVSILLVFPTKSTTMWHCDTTVEFFFLYMQIKRYC